MPVSLPEIVSSALAVLVNHCCHCLFLEQSRFAVYPGWNQMKIAILSHKLVVAVYLLLVDSDKSSCYNLSCYKFYISYTSFYNLLCDTTLTLDNLAGAEE
jgi:hypothetical protein